MPFATPHSIVRVITSLALLLALTVAAGPASAQPAASPSLEVGSPDGQVSVTVGTTGALTYAVRYRGREIVRPSAIAMTLADGRVLGARPRVSGTTTRSEDRVLTPVVPYKRSQIRDQYHERRIDLGDFSLIVRVYDDGMAWRFTTRLAGEITVQGEDATFSFATDHRLRFPEEASFQSHQERLYVTPRLSELAGGRFSAVPVLVELEDGLRVVITEADLFDYPGMDLTGGAAPFTLRGLFPAYPTATELRTDRDEVVTGRAPWIARTRGTREFPWRVLLVAPRDEAVLESDIVYRLASETTLTDTSWIRPGLVVWDWWHDRNLDGVPFGTGVNTDTYKHYIDFAAEHGIPYVILDEGWYELGDLLKTVPGLDMDALASYATQKDVGLILWAIWKTLDAQLEPALDRFARWGIKGIKVDFMQREDQWMVRYYERVARAAAARHMLVDFHGAYKPTGLYRTWPNVVTSEGVPGLENSKWGDMASPDNAVTFPFMRMVAGPVDYTPGAMRNATQRDFRPIFSRPMSQGTRCQQLAMYVVFESPLQMLSDSPSNYRREPDSLTFLKAVPTVWDETRVLQARLGEYIVLARRRGRDWYLGGLTNWTARDVTVDFNWLGDGRFTMDLHRDGPNAHRIGIDYVRETRTVDRTSSLTIHLAPGGGLAARLSPAP